MFNKNRLRRDSFDDRFCDDLTELVISYLPIEDKFRLQCVSKQFQNLIFNKIFVLNIDTDDNDKNNLKQLIRRIPISDEFRVEINIKALTKVLKTCRLIDEINLFKSLVEDDYMVHIANVEQVLNTIAESCKLLKTFTFNCYNFDHFDHFGHSLGHQIRSLHLADPIGSRRSPLLLNFCVNIESLSNVNIKDLFHDNQLVCKRLKRLRTLQIFDFSKEFLLLKSLVSHLTTQLTHLSLDMQLDSSDEEKTTLDILPKLKCLCVLRISSDLSDDYSSAHLPQTIQSIAINCKQLRDFEFSTIFRESFDEKKFYESFSHFSGLKRFSFGYFKNQSGEFDFNCLKNCRQLDYLAIRLMKLNEQCFKGLESIFPRLKVLTLANENRLSDETIASIRGIQTLVKINEINRNYQ